MFIILFLFFYSCSLKDPDLEIFFFDLCETTKSLQKEKLQNMYTGVLKSDLMSLSQKDFFQDFSTKDFIESIKILHYRCYFSYCTILYQVSLLDKNQHKGSLLKELKLIKDNDKFFVKTIKNISSNYHLK